MAGLMAALMAKKKVGEWVVCSAALKGALRVAVKAVGKDQWTVARRAARKDHKTAADWAERTDVEKVEM